mgnify:CR=1 FL=1
MGQDLRTGEIRVSTDEDTNVHFKRLPTYRSHKVVQALKLCEVRHGQLADGTGLLVPEEDGFLPFRVSRAYMLKHNPQPGGYYVRYPDGYESWSPAAAFEEGYDLAE